MKEDSCTEFKEQYSKKLLKAAVAFANTEGGSIYLGIKDDGDVIGVADPDGDIRYVTQHILDSIRPDMATILNSSFIDVDSKTVIKFDISEGSSKPYYLREKGLRPEGVYVRAGAMNVPASEDLILKPKLRILGNMSL